MRDDSEHLGEALVSAPAWEERNHRYREHFFIVEGADGKPEGRSHPFSAKERNKFFFNHSGNYVDLSGISGMDSPADSRGFVLFDFDRDGDEDIALSNANSPALQIWRSDFPQRGHFLQVSLEGGARPDDAVGWSNRSAIGAVLTLRSASGRTLRRELHAGEGFAIQNSKVTHFGLGSDDHALSLTVRWPSGRTTEIDGPIAADEHLVITERDGLAPED